MQKSIIKTYQSIYQITMIQIYILFLFFTVTISNTCIKTDQVVIRSLPMLSLLTNNENNRYIEIIFYAIMILTNNYHFECFNIALSISQNIQNFYENAIRGTYKENLVVGYGYTVRDALMEVKETFASVNM